MTGDDRVSVFVDPDVCIGVGACVASEPEVFDLGDDGVSRAKPSARLSRDRAEAVETGCPSGAIRLLEDGAA
jgi:ferredoxin